MSATDKGYSDLPETYTSPDDFPEPYAAPNETLEVVQKSERSEGPEVARANDAPEVYNGASPALNASGPEPAELPDQDRRPRRRRRWIYIAAILFLILAIALGVGLGVGLTSSSNGDDSNTDAANGSGSTTEGSGQDSASQRGAFNGSHTAVTNRATLLLDGSLENVEDNGNALLFFQHASGDIRWMQYFPPDTYLGGTADQVVATDAKDGTPIDHSLVRETGDGVNSELHVFYISTNNTVKQRLRSRNSPTWVDGPLSGMNYKVLDGPQVALRTGRYTGPLPNVNSSEAQASVQAFVGTSATTIDELGWGVGIDWQFLKTWRDVDGTAAPSYLGFTQGSQTYVAFADLDGNAQLYWQDTGSGEQNTATHPLNQWTLASSVSISGIDPSAGLSSLSKNGYLIGRLADDGKIFNWNVTLSAENSSASVGWSVDPPQTLPGSELDAVLTPSGIAESVVFFYQANGSDITMSTRNIQSGEMVTVAWPIPDD